MYMDNSKQRIQ